MVSFTNKALKYVQEEVILNGLSNIVHVSVITTSKSTQMSDVLQYAKEFLTMLTHVLWRINGVLEIGKVFLKRKSSLSSFAIKLDACSPSNSRCHVPGMSSRSFSYLCTSPCRELCSHGLWGSFWSSWQTAPRPPLAPQPGVLKGQSTISSVAKDQILSHTLAKGWHWSFSVVTTWFSCSLL